MNLNKIAQLGRYTAQKQSSFMGDVLNSMKPYAGSLAGAGAGLAYGATRPDEYSVPAAIDSLSEEDAAHLRAKVQELNISNKLMDMAGSAGTGASLGFLAQVLYNQMRKKTAKDKKRRWPKSQGSLDDIVGHADDANSSDPDDGDDSSGDIGD